MRYSPVAPGPGYGVRAAEKGALFIVIMLVVLRSHEARHGLLVALRLFERRRDAAHVLVGLDQVRVYAPGVQYRLSEAGGRVRCDAVAGSTLDTRSS